jgi:hypothetical protein
MLRITFASSIIGSPGATFDGCVISGLGPRWSPSAARVLGPTLDAKQQLVPYFCD